MKVAILSAQMAQWFYRTNPSTTRKEKNPHGKTIMNLVSKYNNQNFCRYGKDRNQKYL